jgi:hypothetical protein
MAANLDPKPSPALNFAIADAVEKPERILQGLDTVALRREGDRRTSDRGSSFSLPFFRLNSLLLVHQSAQKSC